MIDNQNLYVLTVDAKDLYLANHDLESNPLGYNIRTKDENINLKKFINTFDYSLEQIKLRKVYEKVYRNQAFSFTYNKKHYTQYVINVTFKYSIKEFNIFRNRFYVRYPYDLDQIEFDDGVCIINDELVGIDIQADIHSSISEEMLGKHFFYRDNQYHSYHNFKTLYTTEDLRANLYRNGFVCDGITYRRFKRSSGSARVGKCLFIDKRLYTQMHRWECCGITVNNKSNIDLASFESYISLTCSSIIDTVNIHPHNILIIDDYESEFQDKCIAVSHEHGNLTSKPESVMIKNSIWDGQSLMDASLFTGYEDYCMLLLRNRFFKSACFSTNIQQFFEDQHITDLSQLNGYTTASSIEDIKLITTPSSIKYLKFGSKEQWLDNLESLFGIVKHEKPTHFFDGRLVSTHYQLLNTLHLTEQETEEFLEPTLRYLDYLRTDHDVVKYHINFAFENGFDYKSAKSKNDIVYKMLSITPEFANTKLYYDFNRDLVKSFVKSIRTGHILVRGNYSTLFGNPYEMLCNSIGKFDETSSIPIGMVHSTNFDKGQDILGSRSPHVTLGNILLVQNTIIPEIDKYFNLSPEIVCVNSIGDNILERLSGADFDSDTMMLTDNEILIRSAKKYYNDFLVPTRLVDSIKKPRKYTPADLTDLDIKTSVNKIGEIINLSQNLNSLIWDKINAGASVESVQDIYCDVAKLDVMSNLEIDMAKKEFAVDNTKELDKIREKYKELDEQGRQIKSNFFSYVDRSKGYYDSDKKYYKFHDTTMDYVQRIMNRNQRTRGKEKKFTPFSDIFRNFKLDKNKVIYSQINRILSLVIESKEEIKSIWNNAILDKQSKFLLSSDIQQTCIDEINSIEMNPHTVYCLLHKIEDKENEKIQRTLFNMLFGAPNEFFYSFLKNNEKEAYEVVEVVRGDLDFYGMKFAKSLQKRPFFTRF